MLARAAYATNFLLAASIGVVFVFLADLQDRYGLSNLQFGALASVGFVAALVTQLGFSPLVDRGVIRPLLWFAVLIGSAGTLAFAFVESFGALMLARAAAGVGMGVYSATARKALLGLDLEGGGKKVGTLLSTGVGGFIIGPVIGSVFGRISFGAPFIVISVVTLLVGVPAARLLGTAEVAATQVEYRDLPRLLRLRRVQAALMVQVVIFTGIGVFDAILDRYMTDLGATTGQVSIVLLVMGAPMLFLPRFAGELAERIGAARTVLPGLALVVPAILLYGTVGGALMMAVFGIAHGAGESFAAISGQMLVLEATGTERAAIGDALMQTVGLICATVAAFVAPVIYGKWNEDVLFGGAALLCLLMTLGVAERIRGLAPLPASEQISARPGV